MSAGKVGRAALDDDGRSGCGKATGGEAAGIAGSFEADRVSGGGTGSALTLLTCLALDGHPNT